jgi:hypothetical protein
MMGRRRDRIKLWCQESGYDKFLVLARCEVPLILVCPIPASISFWIQLIAIIYLEVNPLKNIQQNSQTT